MLVHFNNKHGCMLTGPNTIKTACVLNMIKTNKVKKEHYLIRQDNTRYKISIKLPFFKFRTRQIKSSETIKTACILN